MRDVDPLTPIQRQAWEAFGPLLAMLPPALNARLTAETGLTTFEYSVLSDLSNAPDRTLRVSALAGCLGTTRPRMSRVAAHLEAAGHVTRADCPSDGRATNVTLTEEGARTLREATPKYLEHVRRLIFSALDEEQTAQLRDIAATIVQRYRPDTSSPLTRVNGDPTPSKD